MEGGQGGMSIIGDYEVVLKDACMDTSCYWHTSHWGNIYRSGCYMLTDAKSCAEKSGYIPFKEGLKRERPDLYKKLFPNE